MQTNNDSAALAASWGSSLIGVIGTVAAILTGFARIGKEPVWETVVISVGVSLVATGVGLVVLKIMIPGSR